MFFVWVAPVQNHKSRSKAVVFGVLVVVPDVPFWSSALQFSATQQVMASRKDSAVQMHLTSMPQSFGMDLVAQFCCGGC